MESLNVYLQYQPKRLSRVELICLSIVEESEVLVPAAGPTSISRHPVNLS